MKPWDRAAPLIDAALSYQDEHDLSYVKGEVDSGRAQLWCGTKSALVTRIADYAKGRRVIVWLAGGDLGELVFEMLPAVESWGAENKCDKCVIVGRKGWARVLKKRYNETHVVMERTL